MIETIDGYIEKYTELLSGALIFAVAAENKDLTKMSIHVYHKVIKDLAKIKEVYINEKKETES